MAIFHLAHRDEWDAAVAGGTYEISTRGASLGEVGFIHASYAHQLGAVAEFVYARDEAAQRWARASPIPGCATGWTRSPGDGSQKLPIRVLPTIRSERAAGRPLAGATRPLAAWVCPLRGLGATVTDARAAELVPLAAGPLPEATRRILAVLDPALVADDALVAAVVDQAKELAVA